jgi:F-type H+-transporting ATPase subunit b
LVLFILAKFGFPLITGMVEKRNKRINDSLEAARTAEQAIAHLKEEQERIITETRTEQNRLMQEAAAERDRMIAQAQDQARAEAQKIMEDAMERISQEKEAAMKELRNEVAKMSISIAEKVVRKDLASDAAQKDLVDKLLDEITV